MKRLKVFSVIVCFVVLMVSLSSVALAISFPWKNVQMYCSHCKSSNTCVPVSLSVPTFNASGTFVLRCSGCSNLLTYKVKFLGDVADVSMSNPEKYDVFSYVCETCGKSELGLVNTVKLPTCEERGFISALCLHDCCPSAVFFLSPLGHDYIEVSRTPATCTTPGSVAFTCSRSSCNATKTESLPTSGHDYIGKRTEPTCTAPGSIISTCSRCNDTETEVLPALGHDYSVSSRIEPTCAAPGSIVSTCSRCNDTVTEELAAAYHSWDTMEMVPSTYDDSGNIVTEGYTFYTCSTCGSHYTAVAGTSPPAAGSVSGGIGGDGMPDTTAALGKTFLSGLWSLFAITVPGFGFTFGQMWLGVLLASISILVIRMIFGFGGGPRGESSRTSSTSNPRISKERRRDEF